MCVTDAIALSAMDPESHMRYALGVVGRFVKRSCDVHSGRVVRIERLSGVIDVYSMLGQFVSNRVPLWGGLPQMEWPMAQTMQSILSQFLLSHSFFGEAMA